MSEFLIRPSHQSKTSASNRSVAFHATANRADRMPMQGLALATFARRGAFAGRRGGIISGQEELGGRLAGPFGVGSWAVAGRRARSEAGAPDCRQRVLAREPAH